MPKIALQTYKGEEDQLGTFPPQIELQRHNAQLIQQGLGRCEPPTNARD